MRIGLVSFLNAKPLGYGFFHKREHNIIQAPPAALAQLLLEGKLDTALISSVECLRNRERLSWCQTLGICTHRRAFSILYLCRRQQESKGQRRQEQETFPAPIERLYSDSGSRSSVALFQSLYYAKYRQLPQLVISEAEGLPQRIGAQDGGLLIGDAALHFRNSAESDSYQITDVGALWYQQEKLPFVFALWAYPRSKPVSDSLFHDSYQQGLENMDAIVQGSPFLETRHYLTEILHYPIGQQEQAALLRFEKYLKATPTTPAFPASPLSPRQ